MNFDIPNHLPNVTDPAVLTNLLFPVLIAFTGIVAYLFFIRPALRETPVFRDLYDAEEGFWSAINAKLTGVKQKLTTIFLSAISFIVLAHDQLSPLITQAGVDPAQLLPKVPTWAWPLITMAVLALIQHFRNVADKAARKNAEALLNAGQPLAAAAPGLPMTTPPSPSPLSLLPDKAS